MALQRRHPLLRAKIVAGTPPRFTSQGVPPIALEVVERKAEESWQQHVEAELDRPFNSDPGPLVRFILVRGEHRSELLCSYDHLIGDAHSGIFALRDLLQVMASQDQHLPELAPRPAYEELIGPMVPGTRLLGAAVRRGSSALLRLSPTLNTLTERLVAPRGMARSSAEGQALYSHRILEPEQLARLLARCREQGSSVHAALGAALLIARAESQGAKKRVTLTLTSALDARERFGVGEDFGLFTTGKTDFFRARGSTPFWELAHRLRSPLQAARKKRSHLRLFRLILEISALTVDISSQPWMERATRLGLHSMLALSNVGRVEIAARYGNLTLEGLGFTGTTAAQFDVVLTAITFAQRLEASFLFNTAHMQREQVEQLASRTWELLAEATR
uniref:Phthiocerol/phthiodiolone dimycocerosyl transferase n=1 Tax=Archangium disciforme TaxID=38 RepID=Q5ZPB4_9BACT|nr:TubA protein [Archangium disciforme]